MEPGHEPRMTAIASGELVLQNSRQAGARRPLGAPATFVGRSAGCDIRLNVDGVDSLHCLFIFGPDGIVLRDLDSARGTFVNGDRVDNVLLNDGDLIGIGPFQFRLELTAADDQAQADQAALDKMRESLRIQAAAVAAQQAALDEDESRLQKRRGDLEQQEQQLAAHLAEKQRQVQLWGEYTKAEREALRREKLEHEKKIQQLEEDLAHAREEIGRDHQKLNLERQHINKIYLRLRQRWQRQWTREKEKYRRHGEKLDGERQALEEAQKGLAAREHAFEQELNRFHNEREQGLRALKEERAALTRDQESWRKRRSLELTVLNARRRELTDTEKKIAQGRRLLLREKDAWRRQQETLQIELHGLDNRINHLRLRIDEEKKELTRLETQRRKAPSLEGAGALAAEAPSADAEAQKQAEDWQRRREELDRLASELADQRALLMEQYARLVEIHESWQHQRDHAAEELEAVAQRLLAEEETLLARQQQADITESLLKQRQAEFDAARRDIFAWREKLQVRQRAFEEEHERQLRDLRQQEAIVTEQLAGLGQLRQRWQRKRHEETERIQAERADIEREQKETQQRRLELFERTQELAEEKRTLTEKALALEQYRNEVFDHAKDPAAQRRVERLRRRWLSLNASLIASSKGERDSARKELARLEAAHQQIADDLAAATRTEKALAEKQAVLEEREAILKTRQLQVEQDVRKLEGGRPTSAGNYLRLKDEIDAMAGAVFEEPDEPPIDQAA